MEKEERMKEEVNSKEVEAAEKRFFPRRGLDIWSNNNTNFVYQGNLLSSRCVYSGCSPFIIRNTLGCIRIHARGYAKRPRPWL